MPTAGLLLQVDPLLGSERDRADALVLVCGSPELSSLKPPAVVITEGIPPIPVRVLEKICKWEYIDLGSLLEQQDGPAQNITVSQSGQLVVTESTQASRRAKPINIHGSTGIS